MKIIAIKDIGVDTFSELNCKLPILPAGLGSFECKSVQLLMIWKKRFIELYGDSGTLFLDWQVTDQIVGNKNYVDAVLATNRAITDRNYI